MTTRPRNTTLTKRIEPGKAYDRIRAQHDRATTNLENAIVALRGTHRMRFQSYIAATIEQCTDPDELRAMLERLVDREDDRASCDPFWQIRDLLSFIGSLAKLPAPVLPESSPSAPAIPERPEPTLERMTELTPERLAVGKPR